MNNFLKRIKNFVLPHEGNEYKPHFFRGYMASLVAILSIFLIGASIGGSWYIKNSGLTAAVLPAVLVDRTNSDRLSNGIPELKVNKNLELAATMKADDMAKNSYFAHTSPSGVTPWYWMEKANYKFIYAGENLAVDFTESEDVSEAWMNSPKHKKNIIDQRFTEIGIATKEGFLNGHQTIFVVQMFGRPVFENYAEANGGASVQNLALNNQNIKQTFAPESKEELNGLVQGENIILPETEIISEIDNFLIVKNTENNIQDSNKDKIASLNQVEGKDISFVKEKHIYKISLYVDFIYKIMLYAAILAMIIFVGIEVKKQHPKNIVYGLIVILLIIVLSYINKNYLALPGLFW